MRYMKVLLGQVQPGDKIRISNQYPYRTVSSVDTVHFKDSGDASVGTRRYLDFEESDAQSFVGSNNLLVDIEVNDR